MKGTKMFRVMLPLGLGLALLGQAEEISPVSLPMWANLLLQGGALVVLAWAVWHAYRNEMPASRAGFTKTLDQMAERYERMQKETLDRHERWETSRHADSDKLAEALRGLAVTCAETRRTFTEGPKDGPLHS